MKNLTIDIEDPEVVQRLVVAWMITDERDPNERMAKALSVVFAGVSPCSAAISFQGDTYNCTSTEVDHTLHTADGYVWRGGTATPPED